MNRHLDTVQIKMCGKRWSEIDFTKVTSLTMMKQNKAFLNKTKKGEVRHPHSYDRKQCALNLTKHINMSKNGNNKINAKRCNVYELVKMAINEANDPTAVDLINEMWKDNSNNNSNMGNVIAVVDTSSSMCVDDCIPLYNAIGLGIRVSEKSSPEFRNSFITFESEPHWVTFSPYASFVNKVWQTKNASWGGSTNFVATTRLILEVAIKNKIPPEEMEDMVLAIFSDMQINQSYLTTHRSQITNELPMYDEIKKMYNDAGYKPPHILFWNLRKTSGFPTISSNENVTMLSGYSSVLLDVFCNKGIEELKKYTPFSALVDLLEDERYEIMGNDVEVHFPGAIGLGFRAGGSLGKMEGNPK